MSTLLAEYLYYTQYVSDKDITIGFAYRPGNEVALAWEKKITKWLNKKYPKIRIVNKGGEVIIALGGDGTILETARKYQNHGSKILGLNLGQVGFLASVREEKKFLSGLNRFLSGKYWITKKMMLQINVVRNNKTVFTTNALNEVVVQNLLGMTELGVRVDNDIIQHIRGTGALVSTATGSTAFNLSAHGPIIMPDMDCLIITEILDHDIPSPSIIVKKDKKIQLKILSFRERGLLSIRQTGEIADVILVADGTKLFPLKKNDVVNVGCSPKLVNFVELEKNYFFKSLQEKFSFK